MILFLQNNPKTINSMATCQDTKKLAVLHICIVLISLAVQSLGSKANCCQRVTLNWVEMLFF
jgi:hypothetical protein